LLDGGQLLDGEDVPLDDFATRLEVEVEDGLGLAVDEGHDVEPQG
jgi:hypothetical protein